MAATLDSIAAQLTEFFNSVWDSANGVVRSWAYMPVLLADGAYGGYLIPCGYRNGFPAWQIDADDDGIGDGLYLWYCLHGTYPTILDQFGQPVGPTGNYYGEWVLSEVLGDTTRVLMSDDSLAGPVGTYRGNWGGMILMNVAIQTHTMAPIGGSPWTDADAATVKASTEMIVAGKVTVVSALTNSGRDLSLFRSADHNVETNHPVTVTDPGDWPTLVAGTTIALVIRKRTDNSVVLTVAGEIVAGADPQQVRVEPSKANTALLALGSTRYTYRIEATLPDTDHNVWPLSHGIVKVA